MTWLAPEWWTALLAVLAVAVLRFVRRPRLPVLGPRDGERLARGWRSRLAWLPVALDLLGLACAVGALARPVRYVAAPPERLVRDLVLCLDRSSSMAAEDLEPGRSRLAVARSMAERLVAARPGDRIGCIEFARYPDLRCPPTLDHAALRELLAGVTLVEADGPEDATGIGGAVAAAAELLARSPAQGRVVVLLTDGEENVAVRTQPDEIAPAHAAQYCARVGVRVHTIAIGRDPSLDRRAVEDLAVATGGRAFTADDAGALLAVADAIHQLEPVRFAEPRRVVDERFAALLAAGLACAFAAHVLARSVLRVVP